MPNKWIEFVREWAVKNNTTYSCAISKPECSAEYRKKKAKEMRSAKIDKMTPKQREDFIAEYRRKHGDERVAPPPPPAKKAPAPPAELMSLAQALAIVRGETGAAAKKAPAKKAPAPAVAAAAAAPAAAAAAAAAYIPTAEEKAAEKNYPILIDTKVNNMKKFLKKIEQENNNFLGLFPLFSNKKEKKKFDTSKKKLKEELDKLNKEGKDKYGNLYVQEAVGWGRAKYGEKWHVFHPTASKDPYYNAEKKLIDPLYEKAKEILDTFGEKQR
jgi:hypothetical protein